ncbi:hypothetical protein BJG93_32665 (plasmid) [Paraburkholderia sprentiae WSM5005]|uniref:Uncharacterized protein n=1 Tax=Paraburkholderia sprentiae WSM5005 TaxID=754502 RepID=A0ACA8AXC2_9BURK|nr:hypothetical protein [Paraburkholderia sprentiae]APA90355.2 hypothetical protein BJG93_32665 [Paraburkholderia sprentiae WSM5005]
MAIAPLRCHTRSLKNARHLQQHAPELFAIDADLEGFGTGVPIPLLRALHRIHPDAPALRRHKAIAEVLRAHPFPTVRPPKRDALFSGTVHLAQITFNTSGGSKVVSTADMNQIVAYAKHAIVPIQEYCSLYGQNEAAISSTLLTKTVSLNGTSFNNDDLKGWVNSLKSNNGLGDDSCIFVVVPSGVSAKDVSGNAGYHDKADIPYIVAGVFSTGLTLADTADVYAMVVSHEIAEMIVDPAAGGGDPEVCDPCDLNCKNLTRIYFDASDNFVGFNQATPPGGFTFAYYICAIVKPAGAADCPASGANCGYAPLDQACTLIVDKSTYGEDEVRVQLPGTAQYPNAYWVALDGFTGAELGFNSFADLFKPTPTPAPVITITADPLLNPTLTGPQISAINVNLPTVGRFTAPVIPADPTFSSVTQLFLYPYTISFASDAAFEQLGLDQSVTLTLTATFSVGSITRNDSAALVLTKGENPFLTNVNPAVPTQPAWLSFDLRFFKVAVPNGGTASRFGATMTTNAADATTFIASVIQNLTTNDGNVSGDSFDNLEQDEKRSALEFLQKDDDGNFVFNFAVARVRLLGKTPGVQATNVRVFFRLLNAQTTLTDFDPNTTYRTASDGALNGHKIALLGVRDNEYVTVPCFASPRVNLASPADMSTQNDPPNAKNIVVNPGVEVDTFYGCWIDVNQPQQSFLPAAPPGGNPDGGWNGIALSSINQVITRAPHQCLVAEISYDDTPIPIGADAGKSDKLAQRNIAWIHGPNPGLIESRRMPHPVEIKPSAPGADSPDELMIFWGNTPAGSFASLYLPAVSATEVVGLAGQLYASHRLSVDDAHTIGFPAEGVTFVPLPEGTAANAGLLTVELPPGIEKGDAYTIQVRQITDAELEPPPIIARGARLAARGKNTIDWRRTSGQFQFNVVIRTREQLLYREERLLAWLKWISQSISAVSRWRPVWDRYLALIGGRVDGFGGDPNTVLPSPTGTVPKPPAHHPPHHPPHEVPCPTEERTAHTGKVSGLVYDRFGDFEGFVLLDLCGVEHRYHAREHAVERIVRSAWTERSVITVFSPRHDPQEPAAIVVQSAPEPFQH